MLSFAVRTPVVHIIVAAFVKGGAGGGLAGGGGGAGEGGASPDSRSGRKLRRLQFAS